MKHRHSLVHTVVAVGWLSLSAAGLAYAQAGTEGARIAGTWDVDLTVRSCTTGDEVMRIKELATFARGGTLISSTAGLPQASKTPGHGAWQHLAGLGYTYSFKFFRFDAGGALAGWTIIRQEALLDTGGYSYTSVGGAEFYNAAGVRVGTACSTISATRFE